MATKAFIHIGLAKTGTSSIQSLLAAHRREIELQGYYFPLSGTINRLSGHHCLAWSLTESPKVTEFCAGFSIDVFRRELETSANGRIVMVSSEELSSLSFSYAGVRSLLRLFPSGNTSVIAYVREQADFFNSFYQEIVSDFLQPGDMDYFIQRQIQEKRYDYRHWFNIWHDLLGSKLLIRPFDRHVLECGDVVADFLQTTNLHLPRGTVKNVALNNMQVAAVLELIRRAESEFRSRPSRPARRRHQKQVAARLIALPEFSIGQRFWGIEPHLVRDIRSHFVSANSAFFELYGWPNFAFSSLSNIPTVTAISYDSLDNSAKARIEQAWVEIKNA